MSKLRLFCYRLVGDESDFKRAPFTISVDMDDDCDMVKDTLKAECSDMQNFPKDLMKIWKVDPPMEVKSPDIQLLRTYQDGHMGQYFEVGDCISTLFSVQPAKRYLHLVVFMQLPVPPSIQNRSLSEPLGPLITLRQELAYLLYNRLKMHQFIQVRGTPASGKTTLMKILHRLIERHEPDAHVHVISKWPRRKGGGYDYKAQLAELTPSRTPHFTYLLFDDGQDTYPDCDLWCEFFKHLDSSRYRVALLCCYGSPGTSPDSEDYYGTPDIIDNKKKILLWPTFETPLGLLLTRPEYDDMVSRASQDDALPVHLDPQLSSAIFCWTAGHVGTVRFFFNQVRSQNNTVDRSGKECTFNDFVNHPENSIESLVHRFRNDSSGRGFPLGNQINTQVASMFHILLKYGYIKKELDDKNMEATVQDCHRKGWTYSTILTIDGEALLPGKEIPYHGSVSDFTINVVLGFKPEQLFTPIRRAGQVTVKSIPEAQYQDEFYQSSHNLTQGDIILSPEFASGVKADAVGRINFFVFANKWGIEITKEGDRLMQHNERFPDKGAYGAWLKTEEMYDYILLDCRTTIPQKPHPDIPHLLHAVFRDGHYQVCFYNNMLEMIREGPLF